MHFLYALEFIFRFKKGEGNNQSYHRVLLPLLLASMLIVVDSKVEVVLLYTFLI
jgi:hypothetical protein